MGKGARSECSPLAQKMTLFHTLYSTVDNGGVMPLCAMKYLGTLCCAILVRTARCDGVTEQHFQF